ncbi:polysaccharide biosynthesis/export protein [alpha proteobacterium HTCC2255]|nr:polysaccharide biosynthesis/export protein [alpha proteobacterium HTCC2255] [Rhodobacterales bacterium HTCC2255]
MNILFLRNLFIFILLIAWQPIFAQSTNNADLQKLLTENPSLINNISQQDKTTFDQNLISESQKVANTDNNLQIDLSQGINQRDINEKSMFMRYFYALTGEDLNIYGSNEFNQPQDNSLLFFNTIGKNYQLAPGDTIQITITGLSPSNESYQVMNDGTITLENVYPLNVNNLNLNQVTKLILDKILLDDASAEVFVRLNNARLVTVQISGNVKSPRTIAVPAYTPLSRVIAYSGGISDSGSLRNISLSQIGEATQTVDFYDFLQNSSSELDPLVKNGARIFVPFKGPTIAVSGFVNNPGIYELPNGKSEILIKDLLGISGTSFLSSGAELKVSYFDSSGQIATRLAAKNESLKEGEALQVDFIETRDLSISKVYGAVLKDFEIKTDKPLSIGEVIKDGAVLSLDIYTSFALIVGKEVQAINLDEALEDDSITLPVGSDLRLFTKEEYLGLVTSDPNKSFDPLVSKLVESNVAELYLDGVRVAYIPVGQDIELYESVKNFYIPSAKAVYDLALLENKNGVEAFDLRFAMEKHYNPNHYHQKLAKGDRLFIFEDKFYNELILEQVNDIIDTEQSDANANLENANLENANLEVVKLRHELDNNKLNYMQNIEYSRKLLRKANIIKISLDGELFTILPFSKGMTSSDILDKLKGRLPTIQNEFVIVQNTDKNSSVKIKNINYEFKIKQNDAINLISHGIYQKIINSYDTTESSALMNDVRESDAVKVYYDRKLNLLLSPNFAFSKQKIFNKITNSSDFYKLYIGLDTNQNNDNGWILRTYDAATLFSDSENIIAYESNIVHMYSEQYIRDNFLNISNEQDLLKDEGYAKSINENRNPELAANTIEAESLEQINTEITSNVRKKNIVDVLSQPNGSLNYVLKDMTSKLRVINGAVMFPGTYPIADKARLKDLIDLAGVVKSKAASNILLTKSIKENDTLVLLEPKIFKLDSLATNETILSGEFYVTVPRAINQSINGFIELTGEFMVPGNYPFSRKEALQEVIQRAGGLADTAYPLGAVLERESIRSQERESNNILAAQLEASVLTLAQSDLEGVGDQIKAVLGFSQQLRNLPTTGRMTVNIMDINDNFYLQDGDKLMLPKRPSHVSIIGAVQRMTVASYSPNKTYKDYIFSAGGLTKMADVRKAYLLLPNGESRLVDNNTIIPVGSVVVIPPKIDKLSILGLTDIISRVLGNIATSILAINNVN